MDALAAGAARGKASDIRFARSKKIDKGQHFSTFTMHPYNKHLD